MTFGGIQWDVLPFTRELNELDALLYAERFIVESNTKGVDFTPKIVLEDSTVTLGTLNTTARRHSEFAINRLGPVIAMQIEGDFETTTNPQFFNIELYMRPVIMNVNLVPGLRSRPTSPLPGRSSDVSTSVQFDINAFTLPEDARFMNVLPRRLYIDSVTGTDSITPVLVNGDDTETTLTSITRAARGVTEFAILSSQRLKIVRIDGDFTDSDIILFDISLDLYIPGQRSLSIG